MTNKYILVIIVLAVLSIIFHIFGKKIEKAKQITIENVPRIIHTKNELKSTLHYSIDPGRFLRSQHTCDKRESCVSSEGQPRLPKAIIIGQGKCGTTALGWFLELNPYIKMLKEPNYFRRHYERGLDYYCEVTSCGNDTSIVLDKSPMYYAYHSNDRIFEYDPNIKLVLSVREPFERLLSHLAHFRGSNKAWKYYEHFVFDRKNMQIETKDKAVRLSNYYK